MRAQRMPLARGNRAGPRARRTMALRKGLKEFMECRPTATWRSGYAEVCKTFYPGSIPGVASTCNIKDLTAIGERIFRGEKEGW